MYDHEYANDHHVNVELRRDDGDDRHLRDPNDAYVSYLHAREDVHVHGDVHANENGHDHLDRARGDGREEIRQ